MACEVCYGYHVSYCPCCSPEAAWDDEDAEAEDAEDEAVLRARRDDPLWSRLEAAGYSVCYDYDGRYATFESAEKTVRKATRVARRDHRDGKVKAGQRYTEWCRRIVDAEGNQRHEIYKRVIR
jgi:hypothetical protein